MPTSRKDFIRAGIGIAGIIASWEAPAIVRGLIGEKLIQTEVDPSLPSASDYIQDGLSHLYDGIENVGYGEHDNDTRIWTDLVGTHNINLGSTAGWNFTDDGLLSEGQKSVNTKLKWYGNPQQTTQVVFDKLSTTTTGICLSGDGNGPETFFGLIESNKIILYVQCSDNKAVMAQETYARNQPGIWDFSLRTNSDANLSHLWEKTTGIHIYRQFYSPTGGKSLLIGGRGSMQFLYGTFKSIRLYDRILTEEEEQHNYEVDRLRFGL